MPDVHAGAGCVIGFTGNLGDKVIPNIVGVDIGCDMRVLNLGKISDIDYHAFYEHIRGNVPSGKIVREDRFCLKPLVGVEMDIYSEAKQLVTELYCYRELKDSGRINMAILTDETTLIDAACEQFDSVWRGEHCSGCGRKAYCSDPIK